MEVVVFTNGCFDILHLGHIDLLQQAKQLGTKLIVGINSDESVRAIKGNSRPIISEKDRANVLLGLKSVDEVIIFNDPTPQQLIEKLKPDVLVKGGDWAVDQIVGATFVKKNGGRVFSIPLKLGYSTSSIVEKIEKKQAKVEKTQSHNSNIIEGISEQIANFEHLLKFNLLEIEKCGKIISEIIIEGKKILFYTESDVEFLAKQIGTDIIREFKCSNEQIFVISNDIKSDSLGQGDVLILISPSGTSPKTISIAMKAREFGHKTICLTGSNGKKLASVCECSILVPSEKQFQIVELFLTIGHLWCEMFKVIF